MKVFRVFLTLTLTLSRSRNQKRRTLRSSENSDSVVYDLVKTRLSEAEAEG